MPLYMNSEEIPGDDYQIAALPEQRWYPVYCHPNKERKLYDFARKHGIPGYLPEIPRYRVTRGHRVATPVPMFTGYVFLCTTRQQNWMVKQSRYIVRMLDVSDGDEPLLVSELNTIRIYEKLARTRTVEVRPEMVPGKKVIINRGSLQGLEGIVRKRKNACEIIVELQFIGCSLATVEAEELELA